VRYFTETLYLFIWRLARTHLSRLLSVFERTYSYLRITSPDSPRLISQILIGRSK